MNNFLLLLLRPIHCPLFNCQLHLLPLDPSSIFPFSLPQHFLRTLHSTQVLLHYFSIFRIRTHSLDVCISELAMPLVEVSYSRSGSKTDPHAALLFID